MTPWAWGLWFLVLSFWNAAAYCLPRCFWGKGGCLLPPPTCLAPLFPDWQGTTTTRSGRVPCVSDGVRHVSVTQGRLHQVPWLCMSYLESGPSATSPPCGLWWDAGPRRPDPQRPCPGGGQHVSPSAAPNRGHDRAGSPSASGAQCHSVPAQWLVGWERVGAQGGTWPHRCQQSSRWPPCLYSWLPGPLPPCPPIRRVSLSLARLKGSAPRPSPRHCPEALRCSILTG